MVERNSIPYESAPARPTKLPVAGHIFLACILGGCVSMLRIAILLSAANYETTGQGTLLFVPLLPLLAPEIGLVKNHVIWNWRNLTGLSLVFLFSTTTGVVIAYLLILSAVRFGIKLAAR